MRSGCLEEASCYSIVLVSYTARKMEEIEGKALKTQTMPINIVKIMTLLTLAFNHRGCISESEQLWFIRSLLFEVITMEENDVL